MVCHQTFEVGHPATQARLRRVVNSVSERFWARSVACVNECLCGRSLEHLSLDLHLGMCLADLRDLGGSDLPTGRQVLDIGWFLGEAWLSHCDCWNRKLIPLIPRDGREGPSPAPLPTLMPPGRSVLQALDQEGPGGIALNLRTWRS